MPAKCFDRERIANSSGEAISLPVSAIRGNLCFRCFSPLAQTLKCSGCKRAYYCSEKCQKMDWKVMHKHHCKIFQTINEVEEEKYQASRTWEEYREYLLFIVRVIRNAAPKDEDLRYIVQAQAYCGTCRRSAVQLLARKITLTQCPTCHIIPTCSECSPTPSHNPSTCAANQEFTRLETFRITFFEDTGKVAPITCTQFPLSTRKPLSTAANWFEYYSSISDKPQIRGKIAADFNAIDSSLVSSGSEAVKDEANRMHLFLTCATDNLTMPLSIIAALEDLAWDKDQLNIHILGATDRELTALANFEEILHLVPSLRGLHITAVGPGIPGGIAEGSKFLPRQPLDCCTVCKKDGRERSVSLYQGLYHDFRDAAEFAVPDLVVAFNSGWVDGQDAESEWWQTIEGVLEDGIPALFTTYNSNEAGNEEKKMKEMGARFVVGVEENRWRGLVPTPEFIDEEFGMWYNNAYRYVVRGKD